MGTFTKDHVVIGKGGKIFKFKKNEKVIVFILKNGEHIIHDMLFCPFGSMVLKIRKFNPEPYKAAINALIRGFKGFISVKFTKMTEAAGAHRGSYIEITNELNVKTQLMTLLHELGHHRDINSQLHPTRYVQRSLRGKYFHSVLEQQAYLKGWELIKAYKLTKLISEKDWIIFNDDAVDVTKLKLK